MTVNLSVGLPAPAFSLAADGGKTVSLSDYLGKKLVLYFYPKDDTSGCTAEAVDFNSKLEAFTALGTAIIGVSADNVASHDKFKKKYGLNFPLASDETKSMLEAYGVWVEKSMYGKKYMGIERTTILIDEAGKIIKTWNKVKVPGHVDEVLSIAESQ